MAGVSEPPVSLLTTPLGARRHPSADWPAMTWMAGAGVVLGTLYGYLFFAAYDFDESTDHGSAALYGLVGLIPGAAIGLAVALPAGIVLAVLRTRGRIPVVVEVVATALTAAATFDLTYLVLTLFQPAWSVVAFCALATGVPAALAAAVFGYRASRPPTRS